MRAHAIATLFISLATSGVAAQTREMAQLAYERGPGAEECPDEGEVRDAVAARLGYDPFVSVAPTHVTATIQRAAGSLRATVRVEREAERRPPSPRVLTSRENDCAELASAMTLAISVAIDPLSFSRPAPPAEATAPAPAPAPARTPAPARAAATTPATTPSPSAPGAHARLGAALVGSLGAAPGPTLGAELLGGVRYEQLSIDLEARADLPRTSDETESGGRVRSSLLVATLAPCLHAGALAGCALGAVGIVLAEGTGVAVPRSDTGLYAAVGARAAIELPMSAELRVLASLEALLDLTPASLQLDGRDVWTTPRVAGAARAGLMWEPR